MPFLVDDWETSETVRGLSYEGEGVYLALLRHQWREGSIPSDIPAIRRTLRLTAEQFPELQSLINAAFPVVGKRRCNHKLAALRKQALDKSQTNRQIATMRWHNERTANGQPPQTERKAKVRKIQIHIQKEPKTSRASAGDSWVQELGKDWVSQYKGEAPYGEIGKRLKPLVEAEGFEPVQARWRFYLGATEGRYASPTRFAQTYGAWDRAGGAPAQEARISADDARVAFRAAGIPDSWAINPDGYWSREELDRAVAVRVAKLKNNEGAPVDVRPIDHATVTAIREATA